MKDGFEPARLGVLTRPLVLPSQARASADTGKCIWYGECNVNEQGFKQNCVYSGPAKNLTDPTGRERLLADCPNLFDEHGGKLTTR